jgi:hypothetical protein
MGEIFPGREEKNGKPYLLLCTVSSVFLPPYDEIDARRFWKCITVFWGCKARAFSSKKL